MLIVINELGIAWKKDDRFVQRTIAIHCTMGLQQCLGITIMPLNGIICVATEYLN